MSGKTTRGRTLRGARRVAVPAGVHVHVARDGGRGGIAASAIDRVARAVLRAERVAAFELSVTLVSDDRMRALNARFLRRRYLTDVIAFPLNGVAGRRAGDVYIAPGAARLSAREHHVSVRDEMTRLVVHGVLHTLGYDHPDGAARLESTMWRRQERLVAQLARSGRS
ncbi:MAG: rRNA maturation RNase YbeY [Gemmatimonadota bacterium]|nr:rRNA maturation RNase YbeY [Gemmatimonadota bacterium]